MNEGRDNPPARTPMPLDLGRIVDRAARRVTLEELVRSGRREWRVVRRKELLRDLLEAAEVFVETRVRAAERELGGVVARREEEAREEGRLRVLHSLADLGDLVDTLAATLAGSEAAAGALALDRRLDRIFRSFGFERIPTVGRPFDPQRHEALEEEPAAGVPAGTVLRELGRGYHRAGFVLRVARVIVASP